jgi:Fe-S-cluster-containing hydrogenase component 2
MFQLLLDAAKQRRRQRAQLLADLKVKEFFADGRIMINARTCQGLECELCIKACPTKALYWRDGKVGIVDDLCVYCGACVLCCIVDDCITLSRTRNDGTTERFSKPREVVQLCHTLNTRRRHKRVESLFPTPEDYLKRYHML